MLRNEILEKVLEVISTALMIDKAQISEENYLKELGADSLDYIEVTVCLEDVFNIQINDDDSEKLNTVGEIVDYLEKRLK